MLIGQHWRRPAPGAAVVRRGGDRLVLSGPRWLVLSRFSFREGTRHCEVGQSVEISRVKHVFSG
jgi:hypothetical protein